MKNMFFKTNRNFLMFFKITTITMFFSCLLCGGQWANGMNYSDEESGETQWLIMKKQPKTLPPLWEERTREGLLREDRAVRADRKLLDQMQLVSQNFPPKISPEAAEKRKDRTFVMQEYTGILDDLQICRYAVENPDLLPPDKIITSTNSRKVLERGQRDARAYLCLLKISEDEYCSWLTAQSAPCCGCIVQ